MEWNGIIQEQEHSRARVAIVTAAKILFRQPVTLVCLLYYLNLNQYSIITSE